MQVGTAKCAG